MYVSMYPFTNSEIPQGSNARPGAKTKTKKNQYDVKKFIVDL